MRRSRYAFASIVLLAGATTLALPSSAFAQAAGSAGEAGGQADLIFWQSVSDSNDRAQYEAYLAAFPEGLFADLARAKINAAGPALPPAAPVSAAPKAVTTVAAAPAPAASVPAAAIAATTVAPAPARAAPLPPPQALAASSGLDPQFVEHLRAIAMTQGNRYQNASVVIPPRPVITAVGSLDLPAQFCSAVERNSFHDNRFRPLIDRASENNKQAIAHMELLTLMVEEAVNRGDSNASSALAQESRNYEPIAIAIYTDRAALDPIFPRIMAVPVIDCGGMTP